MTGVQTCALPIWRLRRGRYLRPHHGRLQSGRKSDAGQHHQGGNGFGGHADPGAGLPLCNRILSGSAGQSLHPGAGRSHAGLRGGGPDCDSSAEPGPDPGGHTFRGRQRLCARRPEVLLSGNHAEIKKWREKNMIENTKNKRFDIYEKILKNINVSEDK